MGPELRDLNRNVKKLLEYYEKAEEPINEDAAAQYLGVSKKTMQNYASDGKLAGTFSIDVLGNRWYYKSKLIR